jgi:hypothetical protein
MANSAASQKRCQEPFLCRKEQKTAEPWMGPVHAGKSYGGHCRIRGRRFGEAQGRVQRPFRERRLEVRTLRVRVKPAAVATKRSDVGVVLSFSLHDPDGISSCMTSEDNRSFYRCK